LRGVSHAWGIDNPVFTGVPFITRKVIDVSALSSRGVKCYRVADFVEPEFIRKPEDDEVILVYEDAPDFPDGCIAKVFLV
jgi:hypothetical protein